MDISTILIAIFLVIIDIFLITRELKNKLIFAGKNIYRIIMPVIILTFIVSAVVTNNLKNQDIIIFVAILPAAFLGNKRGITKNGILINSYVTPWDKIKSYSLNEQGDNYVLIYKTNLGDKKINFKMEDKEEVKKYLSGIRQLKYSRKYN